MKDIEIDDAGIIVVDKNDIPLVTSVNELEQSVWTIINQQLGEYILEPNSGFDRYQILGNSFDKMDVESTLKSAILSQENRVTDVKLTNLELDVQTGELKITLAIYSSAGNSLEMKGVINDNR